MFRDGGDAPRTPAEVAAMQGDGGSDDWIVMPLQCATQWDSLAHIIDKTRDRIVGRGVLLDVARHKGVRALEPGYAITVEIDALSAGRLQVQEGSLYPALHRMTQSGWLQADWGSSENGRRARFYTITAAGRRQLAEEEKNWAYLTGAVARVLRHA